MTQSAAETHVAPSGVTELWNPSVPDGKLAATVTSNGTVTEPEPSAVAAGTDTVFV